jgi:hypothetical protein
VSVGGAQKGGGGVGGMCWQVGPPQFEVVVGGAGQHMGCDPVWSTLSMAAHYSNKGRCNADFELRRFGPGAS